MKTSVFLKKLLSVSLALRWFLFLLQVEDCTSVSREHI